MKITEFLVSTPAGRFFFHVMSALAEMERELIVERTRAGLAAEREQGRIGGRRRIMTEEVVERCRRMLGTGATRQQVADVIGVGVKAIYIMESMFNLSGNFHRKCPE